MTDYYPKLGYILTKYNTFKVFDVMRNGIISGILFSTIQYSGADNLIDTIRYCLQFGICSSVLIHSAYYAYRKKYITDQFNLLWEIDDRFRECQFEELPEILQKSKYLYVFI